MIAAMNFVRALLIIGAALLVVRGVAISAGRRWELHRHPDLFGWQEWRDDLAAERARLEALRPRSLPKGRP